MSRFIDFDIHKKYHFGDVNYDILLGDMMHTKLMALTITLLISWTAHGMQKKHLRIHFDINKTIIATDAVQDKNLESTINGIIAECMEAAWDSKHTQSYYAYATAQVAQENPSLAKTDETFKKKRSERLEQFVTHLQQYPTHLKQYEDDKASMMRILQGEGLVIFPSFYKTLAWLETEYPQQYSIYLRTFGTDLPKVVPAIQKNTTLQFANQNANLTEVISRAALLSTISSAHTSHWAIRDDYGYWKSKTFQAVGGKPFSIDLNNPHHVSMFFDDNANDQDKPIIYPFSANGDLEDTNELLKTGHIVAVNPKEAILDENYFINKIKAVL